MRHLRVPRAGHGRARGRGRLVAAALAAAGLGLGAVAGPSAGATARGAGQGEAAPGGAAHGGAAPPLATLQNPAPVRAPVAHLSLSLVRLSAKGGTLVARVSVTGATQCRLTAPTHVEVPTGWTACGDGVRSVPVVVDPNRSTVSRRLHVTAWAKGPGGRVGVVAFFVEGPAAPVPAPAPATGASPSASPPSFLGQASSNWSGYVVNSPGPPVTEASGQWTVPTLDCTLTPNAGLATWVGIGGAQDRGGNSSGVLLQTGLTTQCVDGFQLDTAWWEEYPSQPNAEVALTGLDVAPGDTVQASVYEAPGGVWVTRFDDTTSATSGVMVTGTGWGVTHDGAQSFVVQGSTAGLGYAGGTSAEWVAEDYQSSGNLVPLAAFGTITFRSLTTSLGSWNLLPADAVEMVQGGSVLAMPSAPAADGFSVTDTSPTNNGSTGTAATGTGSTGPAPASPAPASPGPTVSGPPSPPSITP